MLEFVLAPADLPRLARLGLLHRAGPARAAGLVWHDTADGALQAEGLSLARSRKLWRLEWLRPGPDTSWPPASPPPLLSEAATPGALDPPVPDALAPVAAFEGRRRTYQAGAAEVHLLFGRLRGVVDERAVCRVALTGPPAEIAALAERLAASISLQVPPGTLAAEALAVAGGTEIPARHEGAPLAVPGASLSGILAGCIGHLLDAMLHWTAQCRPGGPPEAVHQARVATRRLRSILSLFKDAAPCPALEALGPDLKDCAARLGAARDWDVFLAGTGARLAAARPDDAACAAMLRAGERRRAQAYAALGRFLSGPDFRILAVRLACAASLRPWDQAGTPALHGDAALFAAEVLGKRLKRVRKAGRGMSHLSSPALHELRKDCKRLRYAAEFLAPLFAHRGSKPFLKRLAALQDALGLLNDSAGTAALMGQLGRPGRGYAAGLVEGFAAASAGPVRKRVTRAWRRFRAAGLFWHS